MALGLRSDEVPATPLTSGRSPATIPLAILGDSNSHSYQDDVAFKPGSEARGGAFRSRTFNWVEVLARLRSNEVDPGPWVTWGSPGMLAAARDMLGLSVGRAPRKQDYLYNFANSGAGCGNLMSGRFRQAPRLVQLMDAEPARWQRGVVVVRMGLNDWAAHLDTLAENPAAASVVDVTARCTDQIREVVSLIHARHPATKILIVGIANEADDPAFVDRFGTARESANIDKALGEFNGALRKLAGTTPNTAYFDDAAWLVERWGRRDAEGKPDYKPVVIGNQLTVTNTAGDEPTNALVSDHHGGLVWHALWAQSLIVRLRDAFQLPISPITDQELADFVMPLTQPAK